MKRFVRNEKSSNAERENKLEIILQAYIYKILRLLTFTYKNIITNYIAFIAYSKYKLNKKISRVSVMRRKLRQLY